MSTSRGPRLTLSLLAILWIASTARAQEVGESSAVISLVSQTPWTTTKEPMLRVRVSVRNDGDETIDGPVVGWAIGPRVTSRLKYETALEQGPAFAASADTVPLLGPLSPGDSVEVQIPIDVSEIPASVDPDESGVYPLQLSLRSEDVDHEIAVLTTAAIHIARKPQQQVLFSWWTEITSPVAFAPDGSLVDTGWEATLEAGGGIVTQVEAIADLLSQPRSRAAFDLIVSPAALDQLRQASDGYERSDGQVVEESGIVPRVSAETLDRLRAIVASPRVRVHAMPFAAPRLPALLSSGLRTHLEDQWRLGDETFERILEERPDPTVARPPGLAFDQDSVDVLSARGVSTILGADDSVDRPPQPNDFAPPPAAALSTSSGVGVNLILPDPGTQALLSDPKLRTDPVLGAQAVLGELATIWREQPVPEDDAVRGLALDLPPDLPTAIWGEALERLSDAPFLKPVYAEELPFGVEPEPNPAALEASTTRGFTPLYTDDLAETGDRVAAFASILEGPAEEADRLRRGMLYAEASQYIDHEGSGRVWVEAVNDVIEGTFSRLAPDTSRVLTFTSRSGTIPLRMGDPGDRVVNVKVVLASGRVEFLDDNERTVRLDQANQVITFPVEVKAAGPSNIEVFVVSPNGEAVISQSRLVVRSTAVNPIALIITIGAGLVLIGLWSRRLFRRRHP
jgi:uncharacterized protein DUF6049